MLTARPLGATKYRCQFHLAMAKLIRLRRRLVERRRPSRRCYWGLGRIDPYRRVHSHRPGA